MSLVFQNNNPPGGVSPSHSESEDGDVNGLPPPGIGNDAGEPHEPHEPGGGNGLPPAGDVVVPDVPHEDSADPPPPPPPPVDFAHHGRVVARVVTGRPAEVKHIGRLQQAAAGATKTRHLSSTAGSSAISSEEGLLWNARHTAERIAGKTLAMESISS